MLLERALQRPGDGLHFGCAPIVLGINGSVADEQQEGVARDERLGVPWAAEDQFKKRIKLSECSLWTSRRN